MCDVGCEMWDMRYVILDIGYWMLDVGYEMWYLRCGIWDFMSESWSTGVMEY